MGRGRFETALVCAALFVLSGDVAGQPHPRGPGGSFNVAFLGADAVGDLGTVVDGGFGLELGGGIPVAADGLLRFRGDVGFVIYGHERLFYCEFGCRSGSTVTTTNSMVYAGAGPEVVFGSGSFRPYLHGSAGASWFITSSSYQAGPSTTNYRDMVFAWRFGGGIRTRLGQGRRIFLDLGVTRHDNQIAEYLTEGDIVDNPDGSVTIYPNRSDADFMTFKLGLSIATR